MNDYELLDFGNGRRLERFGHLVLDRSCPMAEQFRPEKESLWNRADSRFLFSSKNSERGYWTTEPPAWSLQFGSFLMELRCTPFGHIGLFPEQQDNWSWIHRILMKTLKKRSKNIFVLNLFAYTGGASLAAASVQKSRFIIENMNQKELFYGPKIETVHVDAAKNVNEWAMRNAGLNGIETIRFITDDVQKFVRRELKRNRHYDAIILDPPSYGHGCHRSETWKIDKHLPSLLSDIVQLLSLDPIFVLLTSHTPEIDIDTMKSLFTEAGFFQKNRFHAESISMDISSTTGRKLPAGCGLRLV